MSRLNVRFFLTLEGWGIRDRGSTTVRKQPTISPLFLVAVSATGLTIQELKGKIRAIPDKERSLLVERNITPIKIAGSYHIFKRSGADKMATASEAESYFIERPNRKGVGINPLEKQAQSGG